MITRFGTARSIVGKSFILPEEIEKALKFSYEQDQLKRLLFSVPDAKTLKQVRAYGSVVMMPGPPREMTFDEVLSLCGRFGPACIAPDEGPIHDRIEPLHWLAFYPGWHDRSLGKDWLLQRESVERYGRQIPSIAEMVWAFAVFYAVHHERIYYDNLLRSRSMDRNGDHILFSSDSEWYGPTFTNQDHVPRLGVAAYRKFRSPGYTTTQTRKGG